MKSRLRTIFCNLFAVTLDAQDIIVYGGKPGGIASAIAAARRSIA